MKYISNKAVSILIGIPFLLVTALYVFGSDKNNIPEECRQYVKDCNNNLTKQFSDLLSTISDNKATPEELATLGDILEQLDKYKDEIPRISNINPEIKYLTQSISKAIDKGSGDPAINDGTKIIYLTSYVDRYPEGSTNRVGGGSESNNSNNTGGGGGGGNGGGSTIRTPYRCPNPIGGAIEHGKSAFLYKNLVVNYPEQCKGENRVCNNGTLLGSFTEESCTQVGKSCSSDRGVIEHGKTISSFRSLNVAYGEDCAKNIDIITCTDGKLNGELKFKSCTELAPKGCIGPDGKARGHGVKGAYYKTAQLIGAIADGKDECIRKQLECRNGKWLNGGGNEEGFGGFNQLTCTARINTQQ